MSDTNKDTTQVMDLARAFARRQIGKLPVEALDFAARLIVKAECLAVNYPGINRHPAFRTLGLRLGSAETMRWNQALAQAAIQGADDTSAEHIEFLVTPDRGLVLRTQSSTLDNKLPRERALSLQLFSPEAWISALLPDQFLKHLLEVTSRSLNAEVEKPAAATAQPKARFFPVPMLKGIAQELSSVTISTDSRYMSTVADRSRLVVQDRITLKKMELGNVGLVRQALFRPQNSHDDIVEMAIVGDIDALSVIRLNVLDGSRLDELPMNAVTAIAYSKDSRYIAAGNAAGVVRVWHLGDDATGKPSLVAEGRTSAQVTSLAFHALNHTVYATIFGGSAAELKIRGSKAISVAEALAKHEVPLNLKQVATGIRGNNVYFAGTDGQIYIVDSVTGKVGARSPNVGNIRSVDVFSTSGHLCVVGETAVYIGHDVGPDAGEQLALHCPFEETVIGAAELDSDAVLVFHNR